MLGCRDRVIRALQYLAFLCAALGGALALGADTPTTRVLVSNLNQGPERGIQIQTQSRAQGFSTGASLSGHTLESVEIGFNSLSTISPPTVTVVEGSPAGTLIATLTGPFRIGTGNHRFTPQAETSLAPNTTYYVVVGTRQNAELKTTTSGDEDPGGLQDWHLEDNHHKTSGTEWLPFAGRAIKMRVNGAEKARPPLVGLELRSGPDSTIGLEPSFWGYRNLHTATVGHAVDTLVLDATPHLDAATVSYLDDAGEALTDLDSDSDGFSVGLTVGTNVVVVRVSEGEDGREQSYRLEITRNPGWRPISVPASITVAENEAWSSTPRLASVATLTWSKEGEDAGMFALDAANGTLSLPAQDFENPADSDGDNVYRVTLVAADGHGFQDSAPVTVTVTDVREPPLVPAAPTVAQKGFANTLSVQWSALANRSDRPPVTSYDVQYREGDSGAWTAGPADVTGTSAEISGLNWNVDYQVEVRATNDEGDSDWSEPGEGRMRRPDASIVADTNIVTEGAAANFTVTLSEAWPTEVMVAVVVTDSSSVAEGSTPTSVTVAADATSAQLTLATVNNPVLGMGGGELTVALQPGNGYRVDAPASATVRVVDNTDVFTLSVSPGTVEEGERSTIEVSVPHEATLTTDSTFSLSLSGTAASADYRLSETSLTLPAGGRSVSARLTVVNDADREGAETVVIEARNRGVVVGTATLTIEASDQARTAFDHSTAFSQLREDIFHFERGALVHDSYLAGYNFAKYSGYQDLLARYDRYLPSGHGLTILQAERGHTPDDLGTVAHLFSNPGPSKHSRDVAEILTTLGTFAYAYTRYRSFSPDLDRFHASTTGALRSFLRSRQRGDPWYPTTSHDGSAVVPAKLLNVSNTNGSGAEVARRFDKFVEENDLVACTSMPGSGGGNWSTSGTSYNAIAVGSMLGHPDNFSGAQTNDHGAPRYKPDLVSRSYYGATTTSWATPTVCSAAAVLLGRAQVDGNLANAFRSVVTKAILMAGSTRFDYRISSHWDDVQEVIVRSLRHQPLFRLTSSTREWARTSDALPTDPRYGAGSLNMLSAYEILDAGEFDAEGTTPVGVRGWDYARRLAVGDVITYPVSITAESMFSAVLVWHRYVDDRIVSHLPDYELSLYDSDGVRVARSDSTTSNVELVETKLPAGSYQMRVRVKSDGGSADGLTYGLAWTTKEVLASPTGVTASASGRNWTVSWQRQSNRKYRVVVARDADFTDIEKEVYVDGSEYAHAPPSGNSVRHYRVYAYPTDGRVAYEYPSAPVEVHWPPAAVSAPQITSPSSFEVAEGTTTVATLTATDADTQAEGLSWSIPTDAAGGPDHARFTLTATGELSFAQAKDFEAPDDADGNGSYQVTVRVSNGVEADSADLTVRLANVNEAPRADAGQDQIGVVGGARVTLSGSGTDPDAGDTLTYAWTQTGDPQVSLSGADTETATFTAPTGLMSDATLVFRLRVTDAQGLSHEDSVSVTVARTLPPLTASFENEPPAHDGSTAFTVRLRFSEQVDLSYRAFGNGLFTTTNGTIGRGSRVNPPSNIAWDFSVTPTGSEDVVIDLPSGRACDRNRAPCTPTGRRLSAPASVTIAGPTAAPEITSPTSFEVAEGTTTVATLTATDADTPAADLSWLIPADVAGGPDRAHFTLTAAGQLSFAAAKDFEAPDDVGNNGGYELVVQVTDGGRTDTANLTVTLTNVNEAPTANAGEDQSEVEPGSLVTLTGSGTDPDAGDTLTYAWTQTGTPQVSLSGADTETATFNAPSDLASDTTLTFTLRVTDVGSLFNEDSVTVSVAAPASASPAATIEAGTSPVTEGAPVSFRIHLDQAAGEPLSVAVSVSEAGDFLSDPAPASVAFAVGEEMKDLSLATADDAVIESDSTVTATLVAGDGYRLGAAVSAAVTVADNDMAEWRVSANDSEIDEGASTALTVELSNGTTFAAEQNIALSVSGTAASTDYEISQTLLTLGVGQASVSATLTALDDTAEEAAETVTVGASHGGSRIGAATVTIRANDRPPAQVTGMTVTAQEESLSVAWTEVDGADGYRVQWREDGESYDGAARESAVPSGLTGETVNDLEVGTLHWVRVAATKSGAEDGPWSAEVSGTPLASTAEPQEGDLRLVGGEEAHEGRVEIYHDGQWGTVCDDYWGLTDARVACRQLGYPDAVRERRRAHFGEGADPIWMDNVQCTGSETALADCRFRGWGVHNCRHSEDAGVECATGTDEDAGATAGPKPLVFGSEELRGPAWEVAAATPAADGVTFTEAVDAARGGSPASRAGGARPDRPQAWRSRGHRAADRPARSPTARQRGGRPLAAGGPGRAAGVGPVGQRGHRPVAAGGACGTAAAGPFRQQGGGHLAASGVRSAIGAGAGRQLGGGPVAVREAAGAGAPACVA